MGHTGSGGGTGVASGGDVCGRKERRHNNLSAPALRKSRRCVSLPARSRGLGLDDDGKVLWKNKWGIGSVLVTSMSQRRSDDVIWEGFFFQLHFWGIFSIFAL